jgi:hypothetical protein
MNITYRHAIPAPQFFFFSVASPIFPTRQFNMRSHCVSPCRISETEFFAVAAIPRDAVSHEPRPNYLQQIEFASSSEPNPFGSGPENLSCSVFFIHRLEMQWYVRGPRLATDFATKCKGTYRIGVCPSVSLITYTALRILGILQISQSRSHRTIS